MPRVTAVTAAQVVPRFVPSASRVETSSDHKFCGSGESHKCEKTEIGKKLRQVVTHFFKMKASLIAVTVSCASVASGVNAQNLCRKFSANNRLDCEFLYDLYESTSGESWTNNTGWNTASSFCDWFGVTCSEDGTRVNTTELPSNGLQGTIPASVVNTQLWGFDISGNGITGPLPPVMPTTIWGMNFGNNLFSGSIPETYGKLTNLQLLGLPNNSLVGSIPPTLVGLTDLRVIDVSDNSLTGVQDSSICSLVENLEHCFAQENDFTCPLPDCLSSDCSATCS